MTIDHRKLVNLTTEDTPFVKYITSTDGYQVTDTVTRYTKSVYLINNLFGDATLDLDFAQNKSIGNLVTFSRATVGTYVGSDGLIKTAAVNEPRFDHDPVTGESLGLLIEEERTNFFLNSDTLSTQSVTSTAVDYTLSFYGTGTVTVSGNATGTLAGTGANERVSLVVTATAGTITATVAGTVENGQLEAGSFPSSYISTAGSTATRSPDLTTIEGANFSSWYNQSEGTIFTDISPLDASSARGYLFSDGSNIQRLGQNTNSGSTFALFMSKGSATSLSAAASGMPKPIKACLAYKPGSSRGVIDGQLQTLSTTSKVPNAINQVGIGCQSHGSGGGFLNGHISRLAYFPTRKTDQELVKLTS